MSPGRDIETIPTLSRRERPMLAATMISSLVLRTQSDVRLVELAGEGSEAAFEAIVQRYRRDLLAYCSRLLLSDSRAEDAVQQALLSAWTALRGGAEVEHLKPWLYRITHNSAISTLRRPGWDFDELSESLSGHDAPESDLERRMLMRETLAAVAALPGEQRQAILRTAVEGDSYAAVAVSMGVSDQALRGLVYRARVNLRAAVAAVAPPPLVLWAAGLGRRHSGALAWLSDTLASGGGAGASVGAGAVVIKSAAVLASSAALVGGTIPQPRTSSTGDAASRTSRAVVPGRRAGSPRADLSDSSSSTANIAPVGASARGGERTLERAAPRTAPVQRSLGQTVAATRRPLSIDARLPDRGRTGATRVAPAGATAGRAQHPTEARRTTGAAPRQTPTRATAGQTPTGTGTAAGQTLAATGQPAAEQTPTGTETTAGQTPAGTETTAGQTPAGTGTTAGQNPGGTGSAAGQTPAATGQTTTAAGTQSGTMGAAASSADGRERG